MSFIDRINNRELGGGGGSNTTSGPIQWNGIRQNSGITTSNSNSRFTVPQDGFPHDVVWPEKP